MKSLALIVMFSFFSIGIAHGDSYSPFTTSEKIFTMGLATAAVTSTIVLEGPEEEAHWKYRFPGDDLVYRFLNSTTASNSYFFQNLSNWSVSANFITPFLFPGRDGGTVRWQAVQSYAATGLITTTLKSVTGRERPYVNQCDKNTLGQDCFSSYRNEGFPSGHTAISFTGAGLVCSFRSDLFCPLSLGIALSTGVFRITGNQHFISDVIAGAALGWISGYYLPRWQNKKSPTYSNLNSNILTYQVTFIIP